MTNNKHASSIGFYSGTFDPVHVGHITFALHAAQLAKLSKVVFLIEKIPRNKQNVTAYHHRKAMLELAIAAYDNLELLEIEDEQFTISGTLPLLQKIFPQAELAYLCGSDIVRTFIHRWPGLETLLATARIVIGLRGSDTQKDIEGIMASLKIPAHYDVLPAPHSFVASTKVRNSTYSVKDVDPAVAAYIKLNKLYS